MIVVLKYFGDVRVKKKNVKLSSSVKCCIVDNSNPHDLSSHGRRRISRVREHIQSTRQDTLYIIIVRTRSTCIPEITRRAPRVSLSDGQLLLLLLPVYRVELVWILLLLSHKVGIFFVRRARILSERTRRIHYTHYTDCIIIIVTDI